MKKLNIGFVGYRGMGGSVLQSRLKDDGTLEKINSYYFSTANPGGEAPSNSEEKTLKDAYSEEALREMDVIVSCQGGDYTKKVHPSLRENGFSGFWIDAASALRMEESSVICLSPVNESYLKQSLEKGVKDYIGGNCTVSLLLLAIGGLIQNDLVEWVSTMSYQAASGGGARHMKELVNQMKYLSNDHESLPQDLLGWEKTLSERLHDSNFPKELFGAPLAGSLIPWIDSAVDNGQTREEWKAMVEANKILNRETSQIPIPIDGTCVRIGALRSHSQAVTVKLKKSVELSTLEDIISQTSSWTRLISNNPEDTKKFLSPAYVSGNDEVVVGRVRKMKMGDDFLNLFTVGDQLLWGAADPLKEMLKHVIEFKS